MNDGLVMTAPDLEKHLSFRPGDVIYAGELRAMEMFYWTPPQDDITSYLDAWDREFEARTGSLPPFSRLAFIPKLCS